MKDFVESELPDDAPEVLKKDKIFVNDTYQVN